MRVYAVSMIVVLAWLTPQDLWAQGMLPTDCHPVVPTPSDRVKASRLRGLDLLGSFTQLMSPLGKPVLTSNLATTVAINNDATAAQRAQALSDAQVTAANAYTLADGLGATMAGIYRRKAIFGSDDDGKTIRVEQVDPAVGALIHAANATSSGDSGEGKYAFANGTELFGGAIYAPPPAGVLDVLGKAYHHPPHAAGGTGCGDPRPFMVAPPAAASGPSIQTFDGRDAFGIATNSRIMLDGPTAADTAAGRTGSNLVPSPSFPSGHTTFAYTEALLLAMMVPERYQALAYRASEYGNSRIVLAAHHALDIIGGRTLATYDLAQDLAGTAGYAQVPGATFRSSLTKAAKQLRADLRAGGCETIVACAARDPIVRAGDASALTQTSLLPASPAQAYAFRLNYGLATLASGTLPPDPVPVEAGYLLATRFPYLTQAQRLDVLLSTEGPSGHVLDVDPVTGQPLVAGPPGPGAEVGAYARLDLYKAAGGYAAFGSQVVVDQDPAAITDPDLQPFADYGHADTWANDINGPGGLTKRGSGRLTLAGADTYASPTIVAGGTLEVAGSLTSSIKVESGGTLAGGGRVGDVSVQAGGTLAPAANDGWGRLVIDGSLDLVDGARLSVKLRGPAAADSRIVVLTANRGIHGTFADVVFEPASLKGTLSYSANAVELTIERPTKPN